MKKRIKKELSVNLGKINFEMYEDEIAYNIEDMIGTAIEAQTRETLTKKINVAVAKAVKEYATDEEIERLAKLTVKKQIKESFNRGAKRSYL